VRGFGAALAALAVLLASAPSAAAGERLGVAWQPPRPRVGDVLWLHVKTVPDTATVEGSVAGRPLAFFPYAGGQAALVGFDLETKPGARARSHPVECAAPCRTAVRQQRRGTATRGPWAACARVQRHSG